MALDIITAIHTKNDCYKKATLMTPKGIVVHSTGANNPYLKRYVDAPKEVGVNSYGNHWNRNSTQMGRKVCVHAFIGYDINNKVRVAKILPYNIACWGVGSGSKGSYNYNPVGHLQFEMCEDGLTNKTYFTAMWDTATQYCAELCNEFKLDPLGKNVIVSHAEAHTLGYGSNHADPTKWFKNHNKTMDDFRKAVKVKLEVLNKPVAKPATSSTTTVTPVIKKGTVVNFKGGYHYSSASATSPAGTKRSAGKAKITNTSSGSKHPYHLVGSEANAGKSNSNVYGWVNSSDISVVTRTTTAAIKEKSKVAIKASAANYYPGGSAIPDWVKSDYYHIVTQTTMSGKPVVKGGKTCYLIGTKVNKKTGKSDEGVNTWIDKSLLQLV